LFERGVKKRAFAYDIKGKVRSIGDLAPAIKVSALLVLLQINGPVEHLGAPEEIERLDVE
jgi:hypothetical protein